MGVPTDPRTLDDAVAQARERYAAANPRSRQEWEQACAVMPGGNTRSVLFYEPFPLRIASGEGCRITDADGHTYVDLLGEYTAGLFGHSDPVIIQAAHNALAAGINLSGHTMAEARFAAALCERFTSMDLVRFTNSGTEANLMALATATIVTGRRKIMVFDGAYHGGLLVFSGGGKPINAPHDFVVGTYNDAQGAGALLAEHGDELAAVLVEPMLGAGGCIPGDPLFLEALAQGCSEHGALLIFDEVMTSRLHPGGRQAALGISPDLTTLGKYLAGGMSFGAFGGRRDLMELFDPRNPDGVPHAGTFNNNVLTMTAGVAALTQRLTPQALTALNERGDTLRDALNKRCQGHPMQFTGIGSIMSVHFTAEPIRCAADAAAGEGPAKELFFFDMLEQGIHLARRGFIALSLPVADPETDAFVAAVEHFVDQRGHLLRV
jgi:glutamate-1-semialdehyde 2,1-aminomutase